MTPHLFSSCPNSDHLTSVSSSAPEACLPSPTGLICDSLLRALLCTRPGLRWERSGFFTPINLSHRDPGSPLPAGSLWWLVPIAPGKAGECSVLCEARRPQENTLWPPSPCTQKLAGPAGDTHGSQEMPLCVVSRLLESGPLLLPLNSLGRGHFMSLV